MTGGAAQPARPGGTSRPAKARLRAAARRLTLVALGVALAIAVLEAALQLGALALRATGRPTPAAWLGARRRVLTVGDSNTYGLYLADRADAYPQQFERLWNAASERPPIEVLNLGYPGTNSSRLLHDLPRMLDTLRPEVVIMMVGSNDYWTAPVPPAGGDGPGAMQLIQRYSRVYQLIHMLRRARDHRKLVVHDGGTNGTARFGDVEFALGWQRGRSRGAEAYADLEANLHELIAVVRAHGAEPVLMTYASGMWNYGQASRAMRNVSAASNVQLIDAATPIKAVCPAEPCPTWLYGDHHPTAAGYRLMAEEVLRVLAGRP